MQRFLLGLVLALSLLFVGFEYSIAPDDPLDDSDLLDMLSMDPELSPLLRPENELALVPKAEPRPATKIVVTDDVAEQDFKEEDETVETDLAGDMDATEADEEDAPLEPPAPEDEAAISFRIVEDLPQFPGGPVELMKWLTRNLKYPRQAEQRKLQGNVVAEFIVNKDGSITDVAIVKSLDPACDREVLRVLRMMPRWTAGIQNDQPCRTKVCIPVVFHL